MLLIALLTFCGLVVGLLTIQVVDLALIRMFGRAHLSRFLFGLSTVEWVVVASILSWFGMAIPIILRGQTGVWSALKKSVKSSNGYEVLLFLVVVESTVGSYAAWYAVSYGLALLFPAQFRYTQWYEWVVYFVTILASAAVQPLMFIGFSLLASERNADSQLLSNLQQPAQVH